MRHSPLLIVAAAALALAAVLYPFGWFAPVSYPDTAGYLRAASSPAPWGFERHPLYGWMVLALDRAGFGRGSAATVQFTFHALAALSLTAGALFYGVERRAALALGLAALFGQVVILWGRALIPELPAVSLLLMALALVFVATRERMFWLVALLLTAVAGLSCTLRPVTAPAILLLPALYLLLCRMDRQDWRFARAGALVLLLLAPLVAQSAFRYREVGHFGLVSFAGFNSLGIGAQVLTPELLAKLPEAQRPLAEQVLAAKQRGIDAQTVMPLLRNSVGERSFQTTALDGFDTMARNFDEILWSQLVGMQGADESWVAFDARMGALGAAVLRAAPERYLMWTVGATSRLVGRLLVYNAGFLLALAVFAVAALWNIAHHGAALGGASGRSWTVVALVAGVWVASTSALTVIAAFPALRYTDTAGLMLTALPIYGLLLAVGKTNSDAPA